MKLLREALHKSVEKTVAAARSALLLLSPPLHTHTHTISFHYKATYKVMLTYFLRPRPLTPSWRNSVDKAAWEFPDLLGNTTRAFIGTRARDIAVSVRRCLFAQSQSLGLQKI